MLAKEVKIDNFTQNENQLSWQLITYKRNDKNAKRNRMNLLIDEEVVQSFNTFLPGLAFVTVDFKRLVRKFAYKSVTSFALG